MFKLILTGYFLVGYIVSIILYDYLHFEDLLETLICVFLWPVFLVCALFAALENRRPKTILYCLAAILILVIRFYIAQ